MQQHQDPKRHVQQMRPIEYLKTAASAYKRLRANEHDEKNDSQSDASGIRASRTESKQPRFRRQQPIERRVSATVELRVVDNDRRKIDQMHARVNHTVNDNQHAGHFVHVNVIVERNECGESACAQECDALTQHQHQNECAIEIQALTY